MVFYILNTVALDLFYCWQNNIAIQSDRQNDTIAVQSIKDEEDLHGSHRATKQTPRGQEKESAA